MSVHLTGLRNQIVEHLTITNPINRKKHKNPTRNQRTTDFIDKQIVPVNLVLTSDISRERRFRRIEISSIAKPNPKNFKGVQNDRPARRTSDVLLSTRDKNKDGEEKHTKGKKIGCPETDTRFQLSRGQT